MERAKLFKNGQSQAVRLPKALRFSGKEVFAQKLGPVVVLVPADAPWSALRESLALFSDDFLAGRVQPRQREREPL